MNNNLILCISKFINFTEYKHLSLINREINKLLLYKIPYNIKLEYVHKELSFFPEKLLKIFNPIKLYKIPIIEKKIYSGCTHYIDYIDHTFFKKYSIIRGIDELNRPYISFYYNNIVTTLFQRYSDDKIRWVTAGKNPFGNNVCVFDFDNVHYKENEVIIILADLINNGFSNFDNIEYRLNKVIIS